MSVLGEGGCACGAVRYRLGSDPPDQRGSDTCEQSHRDTDQHRAGQ